MINKLKNAFTRRKTNLVGALALLIGAVAGAFGIDLAPTEIDLIISFIALVLSLRGRLATEE